LANKALIPIHGQTIIDRKMDEKKNIELPRDKIAEFCKRNQIRKLSLFGSAVRGELREDSDIDLLVEFEPGHVPGLAFFTMQNELSEILGRKVDLNTPQFLSRYFRDQVLSEAELQYAAP
jgi:predicted nucleotidyltransferase